MTARVSAAPQDGSTALSVAASDEIKELLEQHVGGSVS
jgi:hypothetical protein